MEKGTYSGKMLIGSILAGVLYAIAAEVLYQKLKQNVSDLVIVTSYLMGLFLFAGFAIWLLSKLVYNRTFKKVSIKQWLGTLAAMLVLTIGFEWIYEMQFQGQVKQYDTYLFVIDNSGSMDGSDPEGLRFKAIENVLKEKADSFSYAVYLFSDSTELVRKLGDQTESADYNRGENQGMTAIKRALQKVLEDLENGTLDLGKRKGHVILLSDGAATDIDSYGELAAVLDGFVQKGVSISTVGLLDADEQLMSFIAEQAGGVFVSVEDIADLEAAMVQAGKNEIVQRNLIDYREGEQKKVLYAGMRIGFLIILGGLIGLQKVVICERFLDTLSVIRSAAAGSVLAGLCMEIGMNQMGVEPFFVRGVFCGVICFTLLREDLSLKNSLGAEVYRGK